MDVKQITDWNKHHMQIKDRLKSMMYTNIYVKYNKLNVKISGRPWKYNILLPWVDGL